MLRSCCAEVFGTFVLVFAGTGAVVFDAANPGKIGHLGVALTFGLVVLAMVYAVGAQMNPAVTVGLWLARRAPGREVAPFVAAQLAGAFMASALLFAMFPHHPTLGATLPFGPVWHSFVLEVGLTAVLVFVVLAVLGSEPPVRALGGIIFGAVITMEALFAGPISGASMNPARSLAPALVSDRTEHLWLYVVAPLLGAILAVPLYAFIRPNPAAVAEELARERT